MEARIFLAAAIVAAAVLLNPTVSPGASTRTANFVIEAPTPELADKIGKAAERYRHDLAVTWLGSPMPNWTRPCPIRAEVAPNLGAGGATSFVFDRGEVFDWDMKIQGSEERILDSVLPHEVTHTIFASHFRRPLPRWADEGACTTVEHTSERNKQQVMLVNFLRTDHGIAFDKLFAMKEYPHDVLPLYSEGYSLARFLIDQGGRQKFMEFVGDGMKSENWPAATKAHYGYANLQSLQDEWLEWVKQGSPVIAAREPAKALVADDRGSNPASGPVYRAQSDDRTSLAAGAKVSLAANRRLTGSSSSKLDSSLDDQGWGPVPGDSTKSVYERRAEAPGTSRSDNPIALAPPPRPVPSTSSRDIPIRGPEYLAQRDSSGSREHQVLLQWTRTE